MMTGREDNLDHYLDYYTEYPPIRVFIVTFI